MYNLLTPIEVDEILQGGSACITQHKLEQLCQTCLLLSEQVKELEVDLHKLIEVFVCEDCGGTGTRTRKDGKYKCRACDGQGFFT